jgi:hypothetical protein
VVLKEDELGLERRGYSTDAGSQESPHHHLWSGADGALNPQRAALTRRAGFCHLSSEVTDD